MGTEIYNATYEFRIEFHKRGKGFRITKDILSQYFRFVILDNELTELDTIDRWDGGCLQESTRR